jgi:hypothetical protein
VLFFSDSDKLGRIEVQWEGKESAPAYFAASSIREQLISKYGPPASESGPCGSVKGTDFIEAEVGPPPGDVDLNPLGRIECKATWKADAQTVMFDWSFTGRGRTKGILLAIEYVPQVAGSKGQDGDQTKHQWLAQLANSASLIHDAAFLFRAIQKSAEYQEKIGFQHMRVSKLLHFYNPALFPIYDNKIIGGQIFKRFDRDFGEFCRDAEIPYNKAINDDTARFLIYYMGLGQFPSVGCTPPFHTSICRLVG